MGNYCVNGFFPSEEFSYSTKGQISQKQAIWTDTCGVLVRDGFLGELFLNRC